MSKRWTEEKSLKSKIAIATKLIKTKGVVPDFMLFSLLNLLLICYFYFVSERKEERKVDRQKEREREKKKGRKREKKEQRKIKNVIQCNLL